MDNVHGNIVNNNMRQVMAKIPGIHIWESDGSGVQIGVAARGLSPNRSWEFNVRQNGYDISSDPFGYPEAYYNPQLQGVQRIQVIRGAGALQYGPQFGGMVNYILRNGNEISKPFELETQQTVGSFGLFNSYNAIGGKTKKINYYAFFDHRNADGWRENSKYKVNNGFLTITYKFADNFRAGVEYVRHDMLSQQPGGLSDNEFLLNARKSQRSRNWMNIIWNTAAFHTYYTFHNKSYLTLKVFGVFGDRNSIGYLKSITVKDSINPVTAKYNNRQVDIDHYRNVGAEARYLSDYTLGKMKNTISGGIRYYQGNTDRFKNGVGDTGNGFNKNITSPAFPQDVDLGSRNMAVFLESIFRLTKKFIVIPGFRYENIVGKADGRLDFNNDGTENLIKQVKSKRNFILFGIGAEFHTSEKTEFYANYTEAYRPVLFSDLTASPTTDIIDPNLKDAQGYNVDFGYRGKIKDYLFFDVSGFYLQYHNRVGTIAQQKTDGSFYNYRTNVGNSVSKGFEGLIEMDPLKALFSNSRYGSISIFTSYSFTDARYGNLLVISKVGNSLKESNLKNKKVENAPKHIIRAGTTYGYKGFSLTYQISRISDVFSDANNTVTPNTGSTTGLIPAYTITDLSVNCKFLSQYNFRAGVNNINNAKYFTRRSGGYPGPGLMPSDKRNFFLSLGARL